MTTIHTPKVPFNKNNFAGGSGDFLKDLYEGGYLKDGNPNWKPPTTKRTTPGSKVALTCVNCKDTVMVDTDQFRINYVCDLCNGPPLVKIVRAFLTASGRG